MMTSKEREQIERRIEEINEQLRITSPQDVSGGSKPSEIEAEEMEELYEERDQLLSLMKMPTD